MTLRNILKVKFKLKINVKIMFINGTSLLLLLINAVLFYLHLKHHYNIIHHVIFYNIILQLNLRRNNFDNYPHYH